MIARKNNPHIYPDEYIPFAQKSSSDLPVSENSFMINLTAGIISIALVCGVKFAGWNWSSLAVLVLFVVSLSIGIWGMEFIFRGKRSWCDDIKIRRSVALERVAYKLLAMFFIWALIVFLYWLFPIYRDSLFNDYFTFFLNGWWFFVLFGVAYFILEDKISVREHDAYWQLGRWLCGHRNDANRSEMIELFRGWGVKFFFLALMFPYFMQRIDWFMKADFTKLFGFPYDVFVCLNEFVFLIDLLFATSGYFMTFRLFNTQIRSSEPTLWGWFVAVLCYWPFNNLWSYYLNYGDQMRWVKVFENTGIWFVLWMSAILLLELIYSLATVALGLRFSNLTYRGLITDGPYLFTKHPAYVFKNISWWMISMPFMLFASDWQLALRSCLLLLAVNALYYFRAKTEENHLSHYPEYVEYALKMNEKSIFVPIAKILPFLKYKAPQK